MAKQRGKVQEIEFRNHTDGRLWLHASIARHLYGPIHIATQIDRDVAQITYAFHDRHQIEFRIHHSGDGDEFSDFRAVVEGWGASDCPRFVSTEQVGP